MSEVARGRLRPAQAVVALGPGGGVGVGEFVARRGERAIPGLHAPVARVPSLYFRNAVKPGCAFPFGGRRRTPPALAIAIITGWNFPWSRSFIL